MQVERARHSEWVRRVHGRARTCLCEASKTYHYFYFLNLVFLLLRM